MNSITRMKTAREGLYGLIKATYMFFAFPLLLLIGIVTAFALTSTRPESQVAGLPLFSALVWVGVFAPIILFIHGTITRSRLLKRIVLRMRAPQFFAPNEENEIYKAAAGKYLGIDMKNGTILYIHRIRKGQVDVVGLTMSDWTQREVEGNKFRIYTKFPELPCIEICTPWAQRWYDTLGAMHHKNFNTPKPFAQYVSDHIQTLEHDHKIHIPKLA